MTSQHTRGHVLQNFVENFSEFSAAQRNAGKHVTLMSELSRLVEARSLMTVGHLSHLKRASAWKGASYLSQTD